MRRQAASNPCGNVNGRRTSVGNSSQVLGGDLEFFYFTLLSAKCGQVAVVGQASACRPAARPAIPQGVRSLVGTGRFELPTCRLGGGRSIHLSYVPTHPDCTFKGPSFSSTPCSQYPGGNASLRTRCGALPPGY